MRNNITRLLVLALVTFATISNIMAVTMKTRYDNNDVFVRDLKLFNGSTQFFVKGVNYSPQPLGRPYKGGFCSQKINAESVFYDACIEEDYFDGVNSNNGYSAKPDGKWWQAVWDRDLPVIKELGANTVRVYHMTSITQSLIDKYPSIYSKKYTKSYAAEHRSFMDTAAKYDLKVIAPIVSEEGILTLYTEAELNRFVEARVDEIGDHPALLMWVVGNELGLFSKPQLRVTVNKMITKVREYMLEKWNRIVPVTTCEVDLPQSYNLLSDEMNVDLFMTNAGYRDLYLGSLWDADINANFTGWRAKSRETGMPVLIGEFGMHDQDQHTSNVPDWANQQYRAIVEHIPDGCIGGLFFQYNEESMKPANQQDMGLVKFTVSVDETTGKNSTQKGYFVPDEVQRKPVIFEALQQGISTSTFKQYSYTRDEFSLIQESRQTLDLRRVPVKAFGHSVPEGSLLPADSDNNNPGESEERPSSNNSSSLYYQLSLYVAVIIGVFLGLAQRL